MSRRGASLAAIVTALVMIAVTFSPERARADFDVSARIGGKIGHGPGVGARLHLGDRAALRAGGFDRGGFHLDRRHKRLLGDRFRLRQDRRLFGGKHRSVHRLIGNRFRSEQIRGLAGVPLPSFVLIGDAELIAQRRRFRDEHLPHDRHARRHFHKGKGVHRAFLAGRFLLPWAPAVPGDDRPVVIVQVMPPAAEPDQPNPPAARPEPLDPRGRIKTVGDEDVVGDAWSEGDLLPDDVPHVTLDHLSYGLPAPPLGEKYARVGNEVLRIDTGSRRVVEIVAQ